MCEYNIPVKHQNYINKRIPEIDVEKEASDLSTIFLDILEDFFINHPNTPIQNRNGYILYTLLAFIKKAADLPVHIDTHMIYTLLYNQVNNQLLMHHLLVVIRKIQRLKWTEQLSHNTIVSTIKAEVNRD